MQRHVPSAITFLNCCFVADKKIGVKKKSCRTVEYSIKAWYHLQFDGIIYSQGARRLYAQHVWNTPL